MISPPGPRCCKSITTNRQHCVCRTGQLAGEYPRCHSASIVSAPCNGNKQSRRSRLHSSHCASLLEWVVAVIHNVFRWNTSCTFKGGESWSIASLTIPVTHLLGGDVRMEDVKVSQLVQREDPFRWRVVLVDRRNALITPFDGSYSSTVLGKGGAIPQTSFTLHSPRYDGRAWLSHGRVCESLPVSNPAIFGWDSHTPG